MPIIFVSFYFIFNTGNRAVNELVKKGLEVKTKLDLEIKFPLEFDFNSISEVSIVVICNSKYISVWIYPHNRRKFLGNEVNQSELIVKSKRRLAIDFEHTLSYILPPHIFLVIYLCVFVLFFFLIQKAPRAFRR